MLAPQPRIKYRLDLSRKIPHMGSGLSVRSLALAEHGGHAVKLIDRDRLCRAIERVAFFDDCLANESLSLTSV